MVIALFVFCFLRAMAMTSIDRTPVVSDGFEIPDRRFLPLISSPLHDEGKYREKISTGRVWWITAHSVLFRRPQSQQREDYRLIMIISKNISFFISFSFSHHHHFIFSSSHGR